MSFCYYKQETSSILTGQWSLSQDQSFNETFCYKMLQMFLNHGLRRIGSAKQSEKLLEVEISVKMSEDNGEPSDQIVEEQEIDELEAYNVELTEYLTELEEELADLTQSALN